MRHSSCSLCYVLYIKFHVSQGATRRCCCERDRSSRTGWSDESGSIRNANEWASFDDGLSTILSENRASTRSNNSSSSGKDRGYNVRCDIMGLCCGTFYITSLSTELELDPRKDNHSMAMGIWVIGIIFSERKKNVTVSFRARQSHATSSLA